MDIAEFVREHSRIKHEGLDRSFIESVIAERGEAWVALAIETYDDICGEDSNGPSQG